MSFLFQFQFQFEPQHKVDRPKIEKKARTKRKALKSLHWKWEREIGEGQRSNEAKRLPCSFSRGFVYAKSVSQIGLILKVKSGKRKQKQLSRVKWKVDKTAKMYLEVIKAHYSSCGINLKSF